MKSLIVQSIAALMLLSFPSQAKHKCDPFMQDLKKVQSKLKQGYSVQRGERLKHQEKQARKLWWQCKNNKLPKKYKRVKG
ncbi:hypothetical protein [Thalassomonas sp. M1454]|uniref:hypothetical protein n=1 Tax=Thalassomonas sp. M1454 TaxID=2594477 RepID=UPI00117C4648|nr:hypothetical protein [Thalassomonas sp. M1454]TRX53960.1 hypothetical protein FNN08_13490 [Thalassomonas sp. M1454]